MVKVELRDNEPFERALRKFKKKWEKAGILRDVRSRTYYLKPSEARKMEKVRKKNTIKRANRQY